ncbi:persephin [Paroedura picta]|uniref:persephin n=1 Tax=Paroedura picta TaxID=143630 RepID=UPI00405766CC
MGTLRLLSLVLLLQLISSRPAGDRVMRKPGMKIQDAPQTSLEAHPPKGAPQTSELLHGPFGCLPPRGLAGPSGSRPKRHVRDQPEEQACHLRSLLVRVKDLGLGYDSEETILFKYCGGSCPKARSNHDMTLSLLLQKSQIPARGEPCCRPSLYEDVAFLDATHQWHEVEKLSASSCSCMG